MYESPVASRLSLGHAVPQPRRGLRNYRTSFTLVEFLAVIAIVAAIIVCAMFFTGPYTVWARQSAGHEVYAVLNEELNRYKGNGGNLAALTAGAPMK